MESHTLETFFKQFPTSTYPPKTRLLSAYEKPQFFFLIETGAVKMSHTTSEGRSIVLHIFFPHAFFSLLTQVSDGINAYDFDTLTTTTVRKIPQQELVLFLKGHADILYTLHLRLLQGMSGLLKRIETISSLDAKNQVAGLLVYFAAHFIEEKSSLFKIKITHQEIADWLGLTRENVSVQMRSLELEKYISTESRYITILDLKKLKLISSDILL